MRKNTKKLLIGVATVVGVLALAGVAFAWHINTPAGTATCNQESGTYDVSFVVTNWSASHPARKAPGTLPAMSPGGGGG